MKEIRVVACTDGLVLLRLKPDANDEVYYIGNPVLPQWIQLPPPPAKPYLVGFHNMGLVTRMHNGALLGYKVVRMDIDAPNLGNSGKWSFKIFSSDTGQWSVRQVSFPGHHIYMLNTSSHVSLNGKLHWLDTRRLTHTPRDKMICTTSQGYFVLIDAEWIKKKYSVMVWRLKCDSWNLEKAWEINTASLGLGSKCVPMAINCFNIHIIYLWDIGHKRYLACNLRTHTKSYGARKNGNWEDTRCFESVSCLS